MTEDQIEPGTMAYAITRGFDLMTYDEFLEKGCTQALMHKWLREKHRYYVSPSVAKYSNGEFQIGRIEAIAILPNNTFVHSYTILGASGKRYSTYKEAMEAGLRKALEKIV